MTTIALVLPTAALEQVNHWADASGLTRAKFYRTALILGARMVTSSLGPAFVDGLTPEERAHISEAANAGITPVKMLQIVLGSNAQTQPGNAELATSEFSVSLPDVMFEQFGKAADSIGMVHEKFYSYAVALGAHLAASTLDPGSFFPFELLVQSTEGTVTPEMWMQAVMERNAQSKTRKAKL